MKRILLITHEASRTGAPLVVLHFARWLRRQQPSVGIDVLAVKGGALADEFRSVADRYTEWTVPVPPSRGLLARAVRKVMRSTGLLHERSPAEVKESMLVEIAARDYDVVLANSLASIPLGVRLKELSRRRPLVIAFIHELTSVIQRVLPDLSHHLTKVDGVWAASELVRDQLVNKWAVPPGKVEVQYECAVVRGDGRSIPTGPVGAKMHVGGSGSVLLRKGYDLFIQVARWVRKNHPEQSVRFTWVGRVPQNDRPLIDHDIALAGLQGVVEFVGELADPLPTYEGFDLFLLTSREDPFPLVCIETGSMGKPIVCFEGATGTAEVLRNGGGIIVPYLDVAAMGQAVVDYAVDVEKRRRDGQLNAVQFANFGVEAQCPMMYQRILTALDRNASS
jgi:glycosyltransferase involved in cell wall biosynthesis